MKSVSLERLCLQTPSAPFTVNTLPTVAPISFCSWLSWASTCEHGERKKESEVVQSCLTLCHTMDCSLSGSSIHGILQAGILEWVAISFSRRSSQPRDWTRVSCIVGRHFTIWATREVVNMESVFSKKKNQKSTKNDWADGFWTKEVQFCSFQWHQLCRTFLKSQISEGIHPRPPRSRTELRTNPRQDTSLHLRFLFYKVGYRIKFIFYCKTRKCKTCALPSVLLSPCTVHCTPALCTDQTSPLAETWSATKNSILQAPIRQLFKRWHTFLIL